jgi:hydrophobe/amphiphile efflux-3 (HAE3) family protein
MGRIRSAFARVGRAIDRHTLVTLLLAGLLLVGALGGAAQIQSVTGNEAFTADNPTLNRFQDTFDRDAIVVLVRGEVTAPETMSAVDRFDARMSRVDDVSEVTSPADAVRAEYGRIPGDEARIAAVVGDSQFVLVTVVLDPGLTQAETRPVYADAVEAADWARFPAGATVTVTGQPAFSAQLSQQIQQSTQQQLGLAVGLMIVALFFLFRGVRLRLLPVVAVFVGVLYTFGAIGYAGVPNSTLTSAVFPILIGLGIDYSVQFHQRYEEELAVHPPSEALPRALAGIGPAVFVAMLAATLGFGATWASTRDSPAFVWFAQTSMFGVVLTFLAALIVLVPLLTLYARWRGGGVASSPEDHARPAPDGGRGSDDTDSGPADGQSPDDADSGPTDDRDATDADSGPGPAAADAGPLGRGLGRVARATAARPGTVLVLALLLTGAGFQANTQLDTLADPEEFIPQDLPAYLDIQQFRSVSGGGADVRYDVLVSGGALRHPETLRWMERFEAVAVGQPLIVGAETPADLVRRYNGGELPTTRAGVDRALARAPAAERRQFYSDGYARVVVVGAPGMSTAQSLSFIDNVEGAIELSRPPAGVDADLTGTAVVSTPAIIDQIENRNRTTALGFAFVFLLLLGYYRDPRKVVAPLVPMAFVVGWQGLYMYALGIRVSPLGASLGALTVGIGAEYTVIVMERYHEEVAAEGVTPLDAVETAATRVGKAITVSGMTTVFGFSALAAAPFPIISDFGFLTVGVIVLTLVAALVTLPPTLLVVDRVHRRVVAVAG